MARGFGNRQGSIIKLLGQFYHGWIRVLKKFHDIDPDEVGADELAQAVRDFLERDSIKMRRETKSRLHTVDIRPGTHKLTVASSQELQLQISLSLAQDDLVKPAEVLQALGRLIGRTSLPVKLITRVKLYVA